MRKYTNQVKWKRSNMSRHWWQKKQITILQVRFDLLYYFTCSMAFKDCLWCLSDEFKLIIETPTGGEKTYIIYQIDWCQDEVIQKMKDDWLSFNFGKIIVRMLNWNHDHPASHPKMSGKWQEEKKFGKVEGERIRFVIAKVLISSPLFRAASKSCRIMATKTQSSRARGIIANIE